MAFINNGIADATDSHGNERFILTSSARMCLFFWLKNFEGSERVLKVNFMYSQFNLGPQSPVFFPAPVAFAWGIFLFFSVFFRMGIMAMT